MLGSRFIAWNTLFLSIAILLWMYFADSYSILSKVL